MLLPNVWMKIACLASADSVLVLYSRIVINQGNICETEMNAISITTVDIKNE
jgi:hypothetical protein